MLPHYSPLKVAESFSILARPLPRAHRPRHRPGAGHRSADHLRAAARSPPGRARRLPHAARRAAGTAREPPARTTTPSRASPTFPASHTRPSPGCWAPRRRAGSGPPSSACPTPSPTSSTPPARRSRRSYRTEFIETGRAPAPRVAVGVWAICAETDEEAQRLAASARMAMMMLRRGRPIPSRRPTRRCASWSPRARRSTRCRPGAAPWSARRQTVAAGLREVADAYAADEVIVVSITHDHEARRRSYELIAEAFDLAGAPRRRSSRLLAGTFGAWPTPPLRRPEYVRDPHASSRACIGSCWCAASRATSSSASTRAQRAPRGRARRARDRRRALAPLPALRQLAAARRRPTAPAREHPPEPRRDRAAAARPPAARQDRPAPDRDQPRPALLRPGAARRRDPALRLAPRHLPRALLPRRHRPPGRRRGRRRRTASTACSARSTSSSRCSPRACTCSPR